MAQIQVLIMDSKDRFATAVATLLNPHSRYNIGTYKERSQHLCLKMFYEPNCEYHEVPFGGYIADILNSQGITEIQTAGFRALHDKLAVFLDSYPVTVVYPVNEKKRICWTDPDSGEISCGRYATYPRAKYRIIAELLSIVDHFGDKNLEVHVASLRSSQYKLLDGYGNDRKKKATKIDTVPDELLDITVLRDGSDLRSFLPFEVGERLTLKDISSKLGLCRIPLWRAVKFLTITEILVPFDKIGKSIIYEVTDENSFI